MVTLVKRVGLLLVCCVFAWGTFACGGEPIDEGDEVLVEQGELEPLDEDEEELGEEGELEPYMGEECPPGVCGPPMGGPGPMPPNLGCLGSCDYCLQHCSSYMTCRNIWTGQLCQ